MKSILLRSALSVGAVACLLVTPAAAAESHPFSIHDMLAMDRIGDPQLSPDGKQIVFVRRVTDLEANRGRSDLWLAAPDGSNLRRLTSHPAGEHNPRWAPDGKSVWFVSSREESSQVWRIPVDGGEAQQVSSLPLDVSSMAISPDGKRVAVSLEVFPDCDSIQCTVDRLEEQAARKSTARVYDELLYRHWDFWKDGRRNHVFVMDADGSGAVDVMPGMVADCPSRPFGGPEDYTFTPDSNGIVFAARDAGREEAWSTDFDLYHVSVDAPSKRRNLTEANNAWDAQPSFSPDGKTLAYLAMREPGYESDRFRVVAHSWPGGKERVLTEKWDRSPGGANWSADSKTIYVSAGDVGHRSLFAIDAASGKVSDVVSRKGSVRWIADAGDRLLFSMDHMRSPVELYSVDKQGGPMRQLTDINGEKLALARMGEPKQFSFAGWNDEKVHGWIVTPADFDPKKKYPVAFLIHGGPQGSFSTSFHYRWNPQAYAGAGYAVVTVDFHGSTGYGQAFTDSIQGDWGGKPLEDLQKGLAAALKQNAWMDGERVCALGASYGGYMINWIAGNWSDRFRCLVNHDGNLDERLAYYDTEELWFPERDHKGTPWDNPESYEKHNPVNYVKNWKTPMLVIHGALDYRVVDTQGMSTFTALQRRGIPSKFVYFPDENHWVLQPHNSIFWHDTVLEWLDQWIDEK